MEKIIDGFKVTFEDNGLELMAMGFYRDEFVWFFNDNKEIIITKDMELYNILDDLLNEDYSFENRILIPDSKDQDCLIWYSDCYYNPENRESIKKVSYLTIKRCNNIITLVANNQLNEVKNYVISFSPGGNGKYSKNKKTGSTLQDDIVNNVYNRLLDSNRLVFKPDKE